MQIIIIAFLIALPFTCKATAFKKVLAPKDVYYTQHAYAYTPKDVSRLFSVSRLQKERLKASSAELKQGTKEACIASVMAHLRTQEAVVMKEVPCAKKVFVFWESGHFVKAIFVESAKTSERLDGWQIVLEEIGEAGVTRLRFDAMREEFTTD